MGISKSNTETKIDEWSIPLGVKLAVTAMALSGVVILSLALLNAQRVFFGLTTTTILSLAFGLVLFVMPILVIFGFFPKSSAALFLYWLVRFFRQQICVFSSLGILYLITIRAPLFSLRGGIPLLNLILLFLVGWTARPVGLERFPLTSLEKFFHLLKKLVNRINSIPAWSVGLVVAILPVVIICLVIYFGLNARLSDYRPYSFWNDETSYWIWLRSFSKAGLNVGYNVPNELVARASFNHYGEGSPLYIYIYGSIAWLVGWFPELPLLINFAILTLAIFFFVRYTQLESIQIIFTGLVMLLTWPVLMYLPMTTHETLNQVIGILLAVVFFVLLTKRDKVGLWTKICFVMLIFFATLVRLSWGLMLFPALFYAFTGNVWRRVFWALSVGLGVYLAAIWVTGYLVPPMNNSIFLFLTDSLTTGPQVIPDYILTQFRWMFRFQTLTPNIAVMFQILVIVAWNGIRLVRSILSKLAPDTILQSRTVFDIYNMSMLLLAGLLFYLQEGFYRTFAPSMLVVYLLQLTKRDYKLLTTLLAINVVFFYSYMTFYDHFSDPEIIRADFTTKIDNGTQLQAELEKWIVFDPKQSNPWCNTVLMPLDYYDFRLTLLSPGIGVSYVYDPVTISIPLKSNYLLFDQRTYAALSDKLNAKLLVSLPIGDLYHNLDAGCDVK